MKPASFTQEAMALLTTAAPFMATLAYKGGSLFAHNWLERAYELGVERISPDDLQDRRAQVAD